MSPDQKELKLQSERNIFRILFVKIYLQGFQGRFWTAKVKFEVYNETLIIILKAGYKNCNVKKFQKMLKNCGIIWAIGLETKAIGNIKIKFICE